MSLFSRLFKRPPAKTYKLAIIKREASRLTVKEWMGNESLVNLAKKYLDTNDFRIMLDVLRNENPMKVVHFDITMEERAIVQARCEGYMLALNNLESLSTFIRNVEIGDPSWGAKESESVESE